MKHTIVTNESICISTLNKWCDYDDHGIFSHLNRVTTWWTWTIFEFFRLLFWTRLSQWQLYLVSFKPFNMNRFLIIANSLRIFFALISFWLGYSSMRLRHHLMTNGLNRMGIVNFIMSFDIAFRQCHRLLALQFT